MYSAYRWNAYDKKLLNLCLGFNVELHLDLNRPENYSLASIYILFKLGEQNEFVLLCLSSQKVDQASIDENLTLAPPRLSLYSDSLLPM